MASLRCNAKEIEHCEFVQDEYSDFIEQLKNKVTENMLLFENSCTEIGCSKLSIILPTLEDNLECVVIRINKIQSIRLN